VPASRDLRPGPAPTPPPPPVIPLRLDPEAALRIRAEVDRAGGREVCFLAQVTGDRRIVHPRAVARGNQGAVLAAARDAEVGEIMVHNHPSGVLTPSDADLDVAARVYEEGLGTAITDNRGEGLYVVVEPPRPRHRAELDPDLVDAYLAPEGGLAQAFGGYEDRPGQRAMARSIVERYNRGGVAVVEAGTGTGKSLAYLLPAALWALRNGERTVISTNTINLQEQLVGKDLPLVERVLGEPLTWALVKGRGNYVSIRRLLLAMEAAPTLFEDDRSAELEGLRAWIETSQDGSLADLSASPSDEVWEEVRSDGDICLKARCPHFQQCFYHRSRRAAAPADLLVANHALLFSDLSLRRAADNWSMSAVLPPYRHVVLDEAHNVEDAATSHLGAEASRTGLFRLLSRLDRNGKGVVAAVEERVKSSVAAPDREELLRRIEGHLRPAAARAREAMTRFFDVLEPRVPGEEDEPLRLGRGDPRDPTESEAAMEAMDTLVGAFDRLRREVGELRIRLEGDPAREERFEDRLLDLQAMERRLESAASALGLVMAPGEAGDRFVRWLEGKGKPGDSLRNVRLAAAPVEPGELLREALFDRVDTAVLTSATLTTGSGDFRFIRDRLGLGVGGGAPGREATAPAFAFHDLVDLMDPDDLAEEAEPGAGPLVVTEGRVPSPFHYPTQALFGVPSDLPEHRDWRAFQEATARVTADFAEITGGGLFVLFTSHKALRGTAALLRQAGVDRRFPLWVHGEASRVRLLHAFTASGRGILLGTSSFWEGVDVPGDPLRGLILQKIPFRVPTEPITQARTEALERRGLNGFSQYQVPLAALRLKQGFGRLIRARTDRGAVLLLDRRILTARYGRTLRDALPDAPMVRGPWVELKGRLRSFYADPGADPRVAAHGGDGPPGLPTPRSAVD
jgi:ATP-dependent DNA helicase DinG